MDDLTLSPEPERFAAEAIAFGRYGDRSAVVEEGPSLLQRTEAAHVALFARCDHAT